MLKKQVAKGAIAACAVMAMVCVAFADGNVFWWKGADWGQFNDPANWDVGAEGEGNPDNLIPGADDAVAHSAAAKIDLGGYTYTIKRRAKNFTSASDASTSGIYIAATLHLTNGTLVVTEQHGAKLNIEVWNGATYRFTGSLYTDAHNIYAEAEQKIHSGGRIEIADTVGNFRLFGLKFTVDEGGVFYMDPVIFTCWPNTVKVLSFTNSGTIEAPKGIYLSGLSWGDDKLANESDKFPYFYHNGGVMKLGGNVGRQDLPRVKQLGFAVSGGKLEITNSVAFVNMSAYPPRITDNASVEIEVKSDSLFNMAGMMFGEDVSITKTGPGDLKLKDAYPASLVVSAGRLIAGETMSLAGISFAAGTQFRVDASSVRLDECESFSNTTFMVDESLVGTTVLLSRDPAILAHAKEGLDAQLAAAGIAAVGQITGEALVVRSDYPYTFNAAASSDLTDPTAWRLGEVPSSDTPVRIKGAGIANFTAESTKFASITVEEGATLAVSGGTEESPVDMPPVELDYEARLLLAEGSVVQITNTFTCLCNTDAMPVFEVATNAKAIVQSPEPLRDTHSAYYGSSYIGNDYGFRLKNVNLKWYGDIQTYYSDTKTDYVYSRLLLGWAEEGETSYIAIDCRGGRYIAAGEANFAARCRTPLVIVVPQPGGTVVPVGTLYFRDYACVQRTSTAANPEIHTSGLCIGRWNEYSGNNLVAGNPASVEFDVLFEGAVDLLMIGYCRIGGGAHVTLRGPDVQWRYVRKAYNDEGVPRTLILTDSGSITVEDGACLDICNNDDASAKGFKANGNQDNRKALTLKDSRMSLLNWYGSGKNVGEVDNSLLEIGYLRSDKTLDSITGVFDGMKSVNISNTFTIAAADVDRGNPSKASVTSVENWNRRVHIAPPLTGTGSLAVSNELSGAHAVYSMTVTVTNGANTATGRAFVTDTAGGAPAALVFADGANWAGEVVADGRVSLTNLASEAEAAVRVSFGSLRLDANFPVRLWKSAGVATNDVINIAGGVSGGCGFVPVLMNGYAPEFGDTFTLGTYPAEAALPKSAGGSAWRIYTAEQEGVTYLRLRYQPRGLCFSFK